MPRYFFNVQDDHPSFDTEGTELRDLHTARAEAICLTGEILRDMGAKFWAGPEWKLEVADERGQVLFGLRVSGDERSQRAKAASI